MFAKSQLRLVVVLAFISIAQASVINGRGGIFVRQEDEDSSTTVDRTPINTVPRTSGTPTQTESPSRTPTPSPPTTRPSPTTPTTPPNTPTPPSNTPTTGPSPSNTRPTQSQSTPSNTPTERPTPTPTPTPTSEPTIVTTPPPTSIDLATITPTVAVVTSLRTVSGSTVLDISSSTDLAAFSSATSSAAAANSAAATNNNAPKKDTGMSTGTRNTIIGVVVGIGGAAILLGLFIVAWRIWGRKKNTPDESDDLMGTGFGTAAGEKTRNSGSPTAPSPFQSTLETYHNPANKNVNASSNF